MGKFIDLTGQRFGRLTFVSRAKNKAENYGSVRAAWNCVCDCGEKRVVTSHDLRNGNTKSCGCYKNNVTSKRNVLTKTTHGGHGTRLYKIWCGMKDRCYCENVPYYKNYGGRGISVCDDWKDDFPTFQKWAISHGYSDNLTLDRIDVNGDYSPDNCRWVTMKVQGRNRRTNRLIEYNGENKAVSEWAEIFGIQSATLLGRIDAGWEIERALTQPVDKRKGIRKKVVL